MSVEALACLHPSRDCPCGAADADAQALTHHPTCTLNHLVFISSTMQDHTGQT